MALWPCIRPFSLQILFRGGLQARVIVSLQDNAVNVIVRGLTLMQITSTDSAMGDCGDSIFRGGNHGPLNNADGHQFRSLVLTGEHLPLWMQLAHGGMYWSCFV